MSLTLSLNNALSGLMVSQQSLAVISQNIANANNANYTRQTITETTNNTGGAIGNGVKVAGIDRVIDQYVSQSAITTSSDVAKTGTISSAYQLLQSYMGQPGASNSLDSYINSFFSSLSQLATTPETSSLKVNAVSAGQTLASQISSLAQNVQNLRYSADSAMNTSVNNVNTALKSIHDLNIAIINAKQNNQSTNALEDTLDTTLSSLANEMDITFNTGSDGTTSVSTSSGIELVNGSFLTQLTYTPSTSVNDFTNGAPTGAITAYPVDSSGAKTGNGIQLVTAGTATNPATTVLKSGNILADLQLRDTLMPNVISQLDNIASNITSAVNAIHNDGSGYPPAQTLTGTTLVSPSTTTTWSGSVTIAALNDSGNPVNSPYSADSSNGNGLAPLTINLGALNDGHGAGNVSVQTIIDQINQYYGSPQPRAEMGALSNIQLVSNSDSLTAGSGTFNFSVNLSNLSTGAANVKITGATMSGGATLTPATFPTNSVSVPAGGSINSDGTINFSADMSSAGAGPYTVSLNVQSTDANGNVTNGVVTYTLNNATTGLRNDKYSVSTASGDAVKDSPNTTQSIITAKLVDANGNEIAKDPATGNYLSSGYLQISGTGNNRVAFAELDSNENGNLATKTPATNEGLSQYYGLNNFFVDNGKVAGSAINMKVTQSLIDNPQNITTGKLSLSSQPADSTKARWTYEIGSGSNDAITALSGLANKTIKFSTSGTLPQATLSFSDYAAEIIGFAASKTADAASDSTQAQLINQGFSDKDKNTRGVNVDEEMANTILFQNAYSANARVISVTKQLFEDLLNVFQ